MGLKLSYKSLDSQTVIAKSANRLNCLKPALTLQCSSCERENLPNQHILL